MSRPPTSVDPTLGQAAAVEPPKSFFRRISLSQWIVISMVVGIIVGWAFPEAQRARAWRLGGDGPERAVVGLPAHDQVVDRAAAVRDAGRGHRRPRRRHEEGRPARVPLDHLFRDRDDARARRRPGGREPREARRAASISARRRRRKARSSRSTHTTLTGVIEHTVPTSFFDAAAKNEVLQIVFFAIIFAVALSKVQGPSKKFMLTRLREPVGSDVQVREHRDGVRADRHRGGDRRHRVQERARHSAEPRHPRRHAVRRADRVRRCSCSCRSR